MRSKSTRKPLRDVSNANTSVKQPNFLKKKSEDDAPKMGDDPLDRLLLVQSDLSSLVRKIDELVVQALQLTGNKAKKEIKHFADVLSDVQTALEPWVPRLQKALSSQSTAPKNKPEQPTEISMIHVSNEVKTAIIKSPMQTKFESLVSPSPLVSWRAECNTEGGKQLFLLTPLPQKRALSSKSKCPVPSIIPTFGNVKVEDNGTQLKCSTPAKFSETKNRSYFVMTPRLKMSPPKSCVLLEPISEFTKKKKTLHARKSTPFPTRVQNSTELEDSESSSSSQPSDDLAIKYPELLGIRINILEKEKVEEETPDWVVSPPMTCAIMEPTDEENVPKTAAVCDHVEIEGARGAIGLAENTPTRKEIMSSFRVGKQPGENTLKKELWTRFEAASGLVGLEDDPILEDNNAADKKGFLDRLDEVLDS